jgi:hypothetical protein
MAFSTHVPTVSSSLRHGITIETIGAVASAAWTVTSSGMSRTAAAPIAISQPSMKGDGAPVGAIGLLLS